MAEAITSFSSEVAAGIVNQQREVRRVQTDFMDGLAQRVVENGGYCDDLTYSTAFFGGIDPDMNWGTRFTNEGLAAVAIPEEFKTARKVADLLRFSVFEPFVETPAERSRGEIESIGIILPGSDNFEGQIVGYRIKYDGSDFMGSMVFNGLSKDRGKLQNGLHSIFGIERAQGSTTSTGAWVEDITMFGVAAARKHVIGERALFSLEKENDNLDYVDSNLRELQAEAREYHASLKVTAKAR